MKDNYCLNCHHAADDKFCSNCGQKTDTHRIRLKHFIMHDMLHGVWHFEKGILFTLKEVFVRPGKAALDYIGGKRIRYYNVFYLSLLLIGLNLLLSHFYDGFHHSENKLTQNDLAVTTFFSKYLKLILFGIVPILSINACIVFKKLKLNLAEHLIISGFTLVGMLVVSMLYFFLNFYNELENSGKFFGILEIIAFFLIPLFPLHTYWNGVRNRYSFLGFVWRILVFYIFVLAEIFAILLAILVALTGGTDLYVSF